LDWELREELNNLQQGMIFGDWLVHQLWLPSEGKQRTELDVVLFHGIQLTATDTIDAWSSTWTKRGHDDISWPQEWLLFDLGEAVCSFSVSYKAHVVTSPHDHISEIAHNLFQMLINRGYKVTSLSLSEWHAWANVVVSLTNMSSN
jgi:hypothetical protein